MTEPGVRSTTEDVLAGVGLSGRRLLVTGIGSGLGLETARSAAGHGAEVAGTARGLAKAREALATHGDLGIDVVPCDLASLAGVRGCADALTARGEPFDVVVADAGVMNHPFGRTVDGADGGSVAIALGGTRGDPPPLKTVEEGAATTVWAAFVAPAEEVAGRYCEDCRVTEVIAGGSTGVRPYAVDPDRAARLWAASEALVDERFT